MGKVKKVEVMKVNKRPEMLFENDSEMQKNYFVNNAGRVFDQIHDTLCALPAFLEVVERLVPVEEWVLVFTDEQKKELAKGALKLMAKKNGDIIAKVVDPKTHQIVANIPVKQVEKIKDINPAMNDFMVQMQLANLAQEMKEVHRVVSRIQQGLEFDRLASAYSNERKLKHARQIQSKELQTQALLMIAHSAEDSRSRLMLGMKEDIQFIMGQPENEFIKLFRTNPKEINERMNEIRSRVVAINQDSMTEATAYWALGEKQAALNTIENYRMFLEDSELTQREVLNRLDVVDPNPENYWTKQFPIIQDTVHKISYEGAPLLLGGDYDE
ncbi:hypothetical protein N8I82_08725 [Granulicatella adiacens]|uniref:hypothetical protein n=1 Tax=Granulicatella adiacens TaxID=46124 RepID=UPI0021D883A4|nr:hypothetical protein [Granulicatella adiacens]UXY41270.1 hypothetical protein N8I82_08725 [Granulicatella adiacens]